MPHLATNIIEEWIPLGILTHLEGCDTFCDQWKRGEGSCERSKEKDDSALVALGKGADLSVIFSQPVDKHYRAVHPPSILVVGRI